MGRLATRTVTGVRLVYAITDKGAALCSSCLDRDWSVPDSVSGCREVSYDSTINRWVGNDVSDFLDAASWESYTEQRTAWVYMVEESSLRSLGHTVRGFVSLTSGREMVCAVCEKRILSRREEISRQGVVELHGVKIF